MVIGTRVYLNGSLLRDRQVHVGWLEGEMASVGVDALVTQSGRPAPGEVLGSRLTYGPPMREVAAIDFIDCNVAPTLSSMSGHRARSEAPFRATAVAFYTYI